MNNPRTHNSFWRLAPGCLFASALGAQTLFVPNGSIGTSTNGGVGIGTSSPSHTFEIYSATPASSSNLVLRSGQDRTPRIRFSGPWSVSNPTESYAQIVAKNDNGGPGNSAASLRFYTSSGDPAVLGERMIISGSGDIGVGTTAPRGRLGVAFNNDDQIVFSALGNNRLAIQTTLDGQPLGSYGGASNRLYLQPFVGNVLLANGGGMVGIGTDSPNEKLEVSGGRIFIGDGGGSSRKGLLVDAIGDGPYVRLHPFDYSSSTSMNLVISPTGGGNVGIGTTTPTHKLSVNGTVRAKEVIVDTGWADYVFADDYQLAPLEEVEAHIREKKHLPGIPSAVEVAEEGVSVGEMQALLLAKIEELTLHAINQEKLIAAMRLEIESLKRELQ